MTGRLAGLAVVVTGTGGGIGRATALVCAREGAHVVGGDLNAAAALAGGVDVLVNNASAIRFGPIDRLSYADWSFTIRHELDIVFLVTRSARPDLLRLLTDPDGPAAAIRERVPLRRWGQPEDVANAILFLASAEASHVSGANIPVDGGAAAVG